MIYSTLDRIERKNQCTYMDKKSLETSISVGLGERAYEIHVTSGLLDHVGGYARELSLESPVPIITESQVAPLYAEQVKRSVEDAGYKTGILSFPAGEPSKNLITVSHLYDAMVELKPERRSGVIALGGGVVGDMAGFIAATYLRGIPFIQVPTTLLAQVDASVGGKVGIDHQGGKNLIGAFHQPRAVLIDPATLNTLDLRQIKAGLAEVIKHGVIADEKLFRIVRDSLDDLLNVNETVYETIIPWNCKIKARVVEQDERESGLRAILNFGHTIGHAIEALTGYERYLHGEAVAIGMLIEARLGRVLGITPQEVVDAIQDVLQAAEYPLKKPEIDVESLLDCMFRDKKVERGQIRFILPTQLGKVRIQSVESLDFIRKVWNEYSESQE